MLHNSWDSTDENIIIIVFEMSSFFLNNNNKKGKRVYVCLPMTTFSNKTSILISYLPNHLPDIAILISLIIGNFRS